MKARLAACCAVIAAGLSLRMFGFAIGLPAFVVKYGGSALWATMVYFLVALAAGGRPRRTIALAAILLAILVEVFRLYHTPWLDAFRLTLPGALLLGRIFSPWNIVAYGAGVGLGVLVDPRDMIPRPRVVTTRQEATDSPSSGKRGPSRP